MSILSLLNILSIRGCIFGFKLKLNPWKKHGFEDLDTKSLFRFVSSTQSKDFFVSRSCRFKISSWFVLILCKASVRFVSLTQSKVFFGSRLACIKFSIIHGQHGQTPNSVCEFNPIYKLILV